MWRNYLTVGVRALLKSRTYAFINIFGLALGLAACLMIFLYVKYELSYDRWIPNSANIYQLQTDYVPQDSGEDLNLQMSSYVAGPALKKDFSQVDKLVYMASGAPTVFHQGQGFTVEDSFMVDGPLFDIFAFDFIHGDPATALQAPGSIVLSQSQAERFFGEANPVGRTLTLIVRGERVDHRVTGVMADLPRNTHLRMNMVVRFDPTSYFADSPEFLTDYGNQGGWVYATLKPGSDVDAINAQLATTWEARNIPDEGALSTRDQQEYRLVNIADVHLGDAQDATITPGNDRTTIVTFALVAILILAMASINFTNLATARATQRAREVALRKVLGARRSQLITQFLGESVLVVGLAMLIALAAVELLVRPYAAFLEADLTVEYLGVDGILPVVVVLVLMVGAIGGLYPALYLSRFQPARILKANKSSSDTAGTGALRNALVIAQFAISIGLMICTAIVFSQTAHVREIDPGYDRDGLIQIENIGHTQVANQIDSLIEQIGRIDGVVAAGRTNVGINTGYNNVSQIEVPGRARPVEVGSYIVDARFLPTMGVEPVAGRMFDEARPADDATRPYPRIPEIDRALMARGLNIIVNELAARNLGFADPQSAIGKQVRSDLFEEEEYGPIGLTIIGVVPDSRFRSAHDPVQPIMFRVSNRAHNWLMVRYEDVDPTIVRDAIEGVWKRIAADVPFSARFSEDIIADLYRAEEARARTFAAFALLAIVIACLGLFGLAAFTAERRTKEIGIRKVFGATVHDIVKLLTWQFSRPVVIANLIAWPVAWWVMRDWLNTFDSRIALTPTPFVLAGLLALVIAIGTIAGHAIRVARTNPIHALRYE